jgi:regulation of enolase protein 1 (concanavalin A-like superfamily)
MARSFAVIGTVSLCQNRWKQAEEAFHKATQLGEIFGSSEEQPIVTHTLGRAYLARGERLEALTQFQEAAPSAKSDAHCLIEVLSGLEEAYEDPAAFRAFCRRLRKEDLEVGDGALVQWYLEPAEPHAFSQQRLQDQFTAPLSTDWVWHDPFGDCSFTVQNGLAFRAANGRDLWHLNRSAPRLLRPVSGDFAVQTVCCSVSEDRPAIGGILLWRDKENYLRLERGTRGPHDVSFHGWLGNKEALIGRGRLPGERLFLRLERHGLQVNALCSADGQNWFTVGHAEFPVEDPVEVGLYAIGSINRLIYPGAYPEGTAIRFESFELWA